MSDESLLAIKQRRLYVLELQQARYGIDCPPHVVIEIEDLRREIAVLKHASTEPRSIANQTTITGDTSGPVLSGTFSGPVTVNTSPTHQSSSPNTLTPEKQVILAAFAQPKGLTATDWEGEEQALRQVLLPLQHVFSLDIISKCTPEELFTTLLYRRPSIVHFQGHGSTVGIILEDRLGDRHNIGWQALIGTLASIESLTCVVLNACESSVHTQLGAQHFHLITTPGNASSEVTRAFTSGFYTALGAGRAIPIAYRDGCNLLALKGISTDQRPMLTEARLKA